MTKSRVLIKPYFIRPRVAIELHSTYALELSYDEALDARKQLNVAIQRLEKKRQQIQQG